MMRIGRSFRQVALVLVTFAFCVLGLLWKPAGLIARPTAAGEHSQHASHTGPTWASEDLRESSGPAQEMGAKKVTAGDAYMNVQVLKDIPSDQLLPSMRYITVALGVSCDFCHDPKSFESDDKPQKATARKMMTMMFAINKDNFNGRREVTCFTCHHGVSHAAGMPTLTAMGITGAAPAGPPPGNAMQPGQAPGGPGAGGAPGAPGSSAASAATAVPTADEIIAKYTDALGGAAAIAKITTFDKKGTFEMPARNMKGQAETLRTSPNKGLSILTLASGANFEEGYNGADGWEMPPGHAADDKTGDDLVRAKEASSFIPGLNLKQDFSRVQVAGTDRVGDRDAYRVIAFRPGGGQVRFYFDMQSGLLLRISDRIDSPLGSLPEDTNFSDYRDVNGVKVPFTVSIVQAQGATTIKWEEIQANVPIDDSRFNKPAAKAAQ